MMFTLVLVCAVVSLVQGDYKCTNIGGRCQYNWYSCSGSYRRNLCNGSYYRQCCAPKTSDRPKNLACPTIISRQQWGARSPRRRSYIRGRVSLFFIHHTTGSRCFSRTRCSKRARAVQNFHMDKRGYSDVGYSFLIGEDGNVYEGRGWGVMGAHTRGFNARSYAASFIGDFTSTLPNRKALNAAKALIQCGVRLSKISKSYTLLGHRDKGNTECPGRALYNKIRTWDHYGR